MIWRNITSVNEFIFLGLTSNPQIEAIIFPIILAMYIITLLANFFIFVATITESSLHTPMYFFITNLAFIDICYSTTISPRMLKDLMSQNKTISFGECLGQMFIGLSLANAECILLPVMAYDRYMAICYPLHYTSILTRHVCIRLVSGAWICGCVFAIFMVTIIFNLPMCGNNKINHFICEPPEVLALVCVDLVFLQYAIFFLGLILLITPITFVLASYIKIIQTILKISSTAGRKKAFSTCSSHMIVVTLFYGMIMVSYLKPITVYAREQDKMIAFVYTVITPMLNPLIYTLRNKEFKAALKNIYKKKMNLFFS
ncbi:olfactory receptor 2G3-like [Bombina bombina]|uniref:olfactory receptor 2G3-like n=1 Tax=Bombina bombina TaxID=8345 RepID=UPI00235B1B93|nr:olfactory receptor 2G3-like [Bombina bombina]